MGAAPCGCDELALAEKNPDEDERETLVHAAKAYQRDWRCPNSGLFPPPRRGDRLRLPVACQNTIREVERLTRFGDADTCPCWYAKLPEVQRAVRAQRWAKRGLLFVIEPSPSDALIEEIDILDNALIERENYEHEKILRKMDEDKRDADARARAKNT